MNAQNVTISLNAYMNLGGLVENLNPISNKMKVTYSGKGDKWHNAPIKEMTYSHNHPVAKSRIYTVTNEAGDKHDFGASWIELTINLVLPQHYTTKLES